MTPQDEATQIFTDVMQELTSPNRDLLLILRRCQHACQLLGWDTQKEWFQRELAGYPADVPVPPHRKIRGLLIWQANEPVAVRLDTALQKSLLGIKEGDAEVEETTMELWSPVEFIISASQVGSWEPTGETKEVRSRHAGISIRLERLKVFHSVSFIAVTQAIEGMTFNFVSQAYSLLRYGNVLTDLWTEYRTRVDAILQRLNLTQHFDAVQAGLQSDNPEAWRNAVFGCRNMLQDVASYVWQDRRETYTHLPGDGPGGKLKVTQDRFVSRLIAYIHQKGLGQSTRGFLQEEMEKLALSVRRLVELQGTAHAPISKEDTVTATLGTYFVLGELAIRTDMQPVTQYA